ncbi:MAG: orotate phosphoribosyltransferase [Nitrospirae bacterium]|nr:orotate phosphoribosyltransferase [Nitrospirota bacterium]
MARSHASPARKESRDFRSNHRYTGDPAMLTDDLARAFVTTQAFKWDPTAGFKLASGVTSPFYVDCRALMAHPGPRHLVAQLAFEKIKDLQVDSIGGLEIGAIVIATAISDYGYTAAPRREWRTFVVRKQPKDHGLGKLIEGAVKPGDRTLIVDDVLTSGASVIKAVRAAREAGLEVSHALVIVDRKEQDGRARVEEQALTLLSLLTIDDLLAKQREAAGR